MCYFSNTSKGVKMWIIRIRCEITRWNARCQHFVVLCLQTKMFYNLHWLVNELSQLIQTRRLRFFGHVVRMDTSLDITRALKLSVRGLSKDWRRPRHAWLRILDADLHSHNLGINWAWKYTQDREHWKHLVETATFKLGACARWWMNVLQK